MVLNYPLQRMFDNTIMTTSKWNYSTFLMIRSGIILYSDLKKACEYPLFSYFVTQER